MLSVWERLPVIVRSVVAGFVLGFVGIIPWGGIAGYPALAGWNERVLVIVPWAILPMSVYLWAYFRWLGGAGWPRATSERRRTNLRANPLSADVWGMALVAGFIGLAALLPLLRIMSRLVTMPTEAQPATIPSQMPFITVFLLLVMSSIIAGVNEESVFRGYVQGPIERQCGPFVAIVVTGTLFGLAHYNHHPAAVLEMLPFYIAVSAVYGGLAYATNSILPSLVLHAGGDVFSLMRMWTTGQPEWQVSTTAPSLVWQTGIDFMFIRSVVVFLVLSALAVWAYVALARTARISPAAIHETAQA
jgi:membrane protease YdiL (CAAX protease family)